MDNSRCVVLVPVGRYVEPACEEGLRQLEAAGYVVRRVSGFAAIDQGRSRMATDALASGFDELFWIDSDVVFQPEAVGRFRSHQLPLVAGIYAKKGKREFACNFLAGTDQVLFGAQGGLVELDYSGLGFMLTRREVYEKIQQQLELPVCNERFGSPLVPFFMPLIVRDGPGHWYLAEDYAFCRRARDCGYRLFADTAVRLFHVGEYGYSWEDAGTTKERFTSYTYRVWRAPEP